MTPEEIALTLIDLAIKVAGKLAVKSALDQRLDEIDAEEDAAEEAHFAQPTAPETPNAKGR